MKQLILLVIAVILLLLVAIFTLQNAEDVSINIFFWNTKSSLAMLLFSTFSLGILVAVFALSPIIMYYRRQIKDKKKIDKSEKQEAYKEKETKVIE